MSVDLPQLLLRIAREREGYWVEVLRQAVPYSRARYHLPMPTHSEEDWKQLARGYLSIVEEAATGKGNARRLAFVGSIVEGMAKTGVPYTYMAHISAAFQAGVVSDWVTRVPEEHRQEATKWLMVFFADYVGDMVDAGIRLASEA